ncbi:MAG TPA: peptidoglycan-associated lipoprotein Pal [Bryobacteraceae bacterium]|nr:peptidoglycan-associated lipoprotein Pal [Bryobacteraceae bacterium]
MLNQRRISSISLCLLLAVVAVGCKKKVPPPPPPPPVKVEQPPPPPAVEINSFTAEPSSIERGQSSTLSWSVANASSITIDNGIGTVQASGSRRVFPGSSTTYTLSATGAGGSKTATATVNVTEPPPPPPPPVAPKPTLDQLLSSTVTDAYFDYDKSDIREDARAALTKDADGLKAIFSSFPDATITVEGHCDERGSAEYNLALGDRRATAAKDFLVQLGVPADKLKTISYGKERPVCTDHDETCWQKNRRAHFSTGQ